MRTRPVSIPLAIPIALASSTLVAACAASPPAPVAEAPLDDEAFRRRGVDGAFVLWDGAREIVVHRELADRAFLPMSTFKIPNTLIGLETGVIPDETFTLRWDGVRRHVEAWNRDQDLASAMRVSAVWYYQEIARRIGEERMRRFVDAFGYGNRSIGRGAIDRFWLDGELAISPRQQVDFLRRLDAGELPVAPTNVALVKRIIALDERDGAVLRGKTGLGFQDGRAIGWLVGYVEREGRTWVYATFVWAPDDDATRIQPMRREITEELLRAHGVWPP